MPDHRHKLSRAAAGRSPRVLLSLTVLSILALSSCLLPDPPQWSPDGRGVTFSRIVKRDDEERLQVWFLDLDAPDSPSAARLILPNAWGARWFEDAGGGTWLYFIATGGPGTNTSQIARIGSFDGHIVPEPVPEAEQFLSMPGTLINWFDFSSDGSMLVYTAEVGEVTSLWIRSIFGEQEIAVAEECIPPVTISPGRTAIAFAVPKEEGSADIFSLRLEPEASPVHLGSIPSQDFLLCLLQNGEALLVYPIAEEGLTLLKSEAGEVTVQKIALPPGSDKVMFISAGNSAKEAYVTCQTRDDITRLYRLLPDGGKWTKIEEARGAFVGARSWRADGKAFAEYCDAGLHVGTVPGAWDRWYPGTFDEHVRAVERYRKAEHNAHALEAADAGLKSASRTDDAARMYLARSTVYDALGNATQRSDDVVAAFLLTPVSSVSVGEIATALAQCASSATLHERNRLLRAAAEAAGAMDAGRHAEAAGELENSLLLAGDPRLVAGIHFRLGDICFRLGDFPAGAKHFKVASNQEDFRDRDYACALAGIGWMLLGKRALANEYFLKGFHTCPDSPLAQDLAALKRLNSRVTFAKHVVTSSAAGPGGISAKARLRYHASVVCSLDPVEVFTDAPVEGGVVFVSFKDPGDVATRLSSRRVFVRLRVTSELLIKDAGGNERRILSELPMRLEELGFDESGRVLGLVVRGGEGKQEFIAVGVTGKVLAGDKGVLDGTRRPAKRIAGYGFRAEGNSVELTLLDEAGRKNVVSIPLPDRQGERKERDTF